jgi:glutathione S-transferase
LAQSVCACLSLTRSLTAAGGCQWLSLSSGLIVAAIRRPGNEQFMITIYHLDNSRSERIVWLMEELGLPYEQQTFMRENRASPPALFDIHPIGTSPLIRDGDEVIMESGAIIEYIINRHGEGRLAPAVSSPDYARYLQWLHFAEGSAMSGLIRTFSIKQIAKDSPGVQAGEARAERMFRFIEQELGKRNYMAGNDFTAADIMMEYCFGFVENFAKQSLEGSPNTIAWLKRVRSRPAYQRKMEVAAPKVKIG